MGQSVCLDPCSRHVEDRKTTHTWLLGRKQQETSGYLNPGSRSMPCYRQVQRFKNTTCKFCFLGPKTQIGTSETIIRLIKTVRSGARKTERLALSLTHTHTLAHTQTPPLSYTHSHESRGQHLANARRKRERERKKNGTHALTHTHTHTHYCEK